MTRELLKTINTPADLKKVAPGDLPQVAAELRTFILDTVSKLGGHLGSSLGAAEITIALHYAFDTPKDKLVWDTGHQTYGHKILTGRREKMGAIRQFGGLSGFLKRSESEYDAFGAGHASTAISAALGMAVARDLKGEKNKVVAIVSDGCMTGGESYEGLQNAGQVQTDLIVVLNDNQMFISNRVGALGTFLSKLLTLGAVRGAEHSIKKFLARFQFWGSSILRLAKRAKVLLFPGMLFEEMGFTYFGPVDGHDVSQLAAVFKHVKQLNGPILVHCVTKKGKGYAAAEADQYAWHGPGKFDVATAKFLKTPVAKAPPPTYTAAFGKAVLREAENDPRIVGITAAMPEGTGMDGFRDRFPKRYFDVGLAEEHAVTFAAGLACEGYRPIVAIYSTFLQRAYDQIEHDVCLQKLPVIFCLDRAGLVGEDGPTHHGVFDYSYLRIIPGMTVMAPADENELQHMLRTAIEMNAPVSIRYPRGAGVGVSVDAEPKALPVGKGVRLKDGADVTLLAIGNRVHPALEAAQILEDKGLSVGVVNMRFVKPLDVELLKECAAKTPRLVTVEDNVLQGGFGSAVLEALDFVLSHSTHSGRAEVLRLGIPDAFIEHGAPHLLYDRVGLSGPKIAERVAAWLPQKSKIHIEKLVLAKIRGFCAGVVRAIEVVERALELCDGKVYVRHEIIHNRYVVDELRKKGAVFVEDLAEVPEGAWLIFSAHGVGPEVVAEARARKLKIIDATCPLVTKVHLEAIALAKRDYTIILIGHRDHVETIGTMGETPEHMIIVGDIKEAETITVPDPEKIAYLTQTTLSLDDTREIVAVLKRRFPKLMPPRKDDICYATQNRQNAVKALVPEVDLLLVLGAPNSSNSNRLCEVARSKGISSHLIERAADIKDVWLAGVKTLGLTSGASAPEILVQEVVNLCKERYGVGSVEELETVEENEHFGLPSEIIKMIKGKGVS